MKCDVISFHAAKEILNDYRDRFISEMNANAVVQELFHKNIISDGDQEDIARADGPSHRNTILHACLVRTCTNEALMTACGIIIAVQGNPKMSALGKDMQRSLESGVCACACVCPLCSTSSLMRCSHPLCKFAMCV